MTRTVQSWKRTTSEMRAGMRSAIAAVGLLLATGLLAAPANADPAPVDVGTTGQNGWITVTATSPGSSAGSGGGSSAPVGSSGGGSAAPVGAGSGIAGSSSSGSPGGGSGRGSGGSSSSGTSSMSTGPTLDGYGGALCSNDTGSTCSGILGGSTANFANPTGFLNGSGALLCGLGTTAACPTPGTAAAPAAPVAPGAPPAAPPPPPPPSPGVVAEIAISQLKLTAATPHVSADPNTAVGLPVWMWVDQSPNTTGPVSTTATAGPTSVTAVATLSRIDWSMGPAGAVVSCAGPGTPAPAGPIFHGNNSPACGYSYALRSLPERTGGTGKWPITATAVWNITWFGAGQAGGQGLNLTARTAVEVGELQSVFVAPGGGN